MDSDSTVQEPIRACKVLYGLPCAECKTYYSAGLTACPVCKCRERVPARPGATPKLEQDTSPKSTARTSGEFFSGVADLTSA
jgi:hypothetical protein